MKIARPKKQVTVVSVIILLVLSLFIIGISFVNYRQSIIKNLENAEFIVNRVDLIDSTPSSVIANGSGYVEGVSNDSISGIKVTSLFLTIYNQTELLSTLELPFSNDQLISGIVFQVEIPLNSVDPAPLSTNVITNILIGKNFDLSFDATIRYSIGGVGQSIDFSNTLQFRLEQESVSVLLNKIELGDTLMSDPLMDFDLFNPFTLLITLEGSVDILFSDLFVGTISIVETEFASGWTKLTESLDLMIPVNEMIGAYLANVSSSASLTSDLVLGLGELKIDIAPTLPITPPDIALDFNVTEIDNIDINFVNQEVTSNITLQISSMLPIDLNLTAFAANIYTSSDQEMGAILWESTISRSLEANQSLVIDNLTLSVDIQFLGSFAVDILNSQVVFDDLLLSIDLYGVIYQYEVQGNSIQV